MPLDEQHPIWPEGPDCDEQCPGKWSQYHDGFAWGYEKALAAERARIRAAVEGLPIWLPGTQSPRLHGSPEADDYWREVVALPAVLAIIDDDA